MATLFQSSTSQQTRFTPCSTAYFMTSLYKRSPDPTVSVLLPDHQVLKVDDPALPGRIAVIDEGHSQNLIIFLGQKDLEARILAKTVPDQLLFR